MRAEGRIDPEWVVLPPDEAPAPGGVAETLLHRLDRTISRLEDPSLRPAWVVHEVRKDLKRVRAVLRLGERVASTRPLEKRCSAAARRLSHLRDAQAARETVIRLRLRADADERPAVEELETWLASRAAAAGDPGLPRQVAEEVAAELKAVRQAVFELHLETLDDAALDAALADTWAATERVFREVEQEPVLTRFHDLRKAIKRELHQRELSGRPLAREERGALKKLADVLGELQDLDVLRELLRSAGRWRGPVRRLVQRTIRELKARALRLGESRFRESAS